MRQTVMRSPKSSCEKGRDVIRIKCTAIRPGSVSRRLSKEFGLKSHRPAKKSHLPPERKREMFYLTTHSTHFIYGYMASDIWLRTILIVRKETRCRHIGYSYRLTARVLLYAPSHRQDNTYHGLCSPVVEHWLEREIAQSPDTNDEEKETGLSQTSSPLEFR